MELTKEYFDKQLALNKEYFDQQFEKRFDKLVTKDYLEEKLAAQTNELKQFAEQQTESLARIIATTVAEPLEDLRTRVGSLEQNMRQAYQ